MRSDLDLFIPDQGRAMGRWFETAKALNAEVPVTTYTSTRRGETVEIRHQPKEVTANAIATGERLIKDAISSYRMLARNIGVLAFQDENGNLAMPPLRTNSVKIGQRRELSDRQARSHVRKLQKAGLVRDYKFRGTNADFEVWINEAVLFGAETPVFTAIRTQVVDKLVDSVVVAENQAPKSIAEIASTEDFSAYQVTIIHSNIETEKKADGNVHGDALSVEHGDQKHSDTERLQPETPTEWQTDALGSEGHGDLGGGGRAAAPNVDNPQLGPAGIAVVATPGKTAGQRAKAKLTKADRQARTTANRTPQQHRAILEGYLSSFWRYAQKMLYPARPVPEWEEPLILNAIRLGVYRNFEPDLTETEWDNYQAELYKRIDIAAGWYERHPEKWVPAPYAQMRPGAGYFDWENERGFAKTGDWLAQNQRLYRQTYITQRISQAVRHLQLHRVDKAPKVLQQKNYIEAYRYLEAQIGTKYGQVAQDRFRALAATIGQQKPKLTPGFTKIFKK